MLINDSDALKKLSSPMNLINQLRKSSPIRNEAMSLFIPSTEKDKVKVSFNPFRSVAVPLAVNIPSQIVPAVVEPETLDSILQNHEAQIRLGLAHDKALDLLNRSVQMLTDKLDDISAAKLPSVVSAASKTVESIRRERNEASKNNKDREVHYHFYTPQQNKVSDYEIIEVQ
jgi:hypothetical protein